MTFIYFRYITSFMWNKSFTALKTFLQEYCINQPCFQYQLCDEPVPRLYCDRTNATKHACLQWCIGEGKGCLNIEECCATELECMNQICRTAQSRLDLVVFSKFALALAPIFTIFAMILLCWKGFVEPKCKSSSSCINEDNTSTSSPERNVREGYKVRTEKPPSYEECIQQNHVVWSLRQPPPYTIASNMTDGNISSLSNIRPDYYLACTSNISQLDVHTIKLQDVPIRNVSEVTVTSPVINMEDFVFVPTGDTSSAETGSNDKHEDQSNPSRPDKKENDYNV